MTTWLDASPLFRQFTGDDPLGRGAAVRNRRTDTLAPRTRTADRVVKSICPCCARFGVFNAGMAGAEDPRCTVEPQRERLRAGQAAGPG
jgi:hypothetical protein